MKAGVPVITSDVTSMPEIAGEAALLCDPFSVDSISNAMQQIASSEQLRSTLITKGLRRAAEFTWEKTAEGVWGAVCKCGN
jgi:glycosyltransferase involved in cell wall biosynthesis